jgi:hypothetical protein
VKSAKREWTQEEVSELYRLAKQRGGLGAIAKELICRALEDAGVEFIPAKGGKAVGMRLLRD